MHPQSAAIVAAARSCVGTRFRVQGRMPGVGLDCIGVALVAAAAVGIRCVTPRYAIGGDGEAALDVALAALGCMAIELPEAGDLVVVAPAPNRRHLGIATSLGMIHAHAGLRRVVEAPVDPCWARVGTWRFPTHQEN